METERQTQKGKEGLILKENVRERMFEKMADLRERV